MAKQLSIAGAGPEPTVDHVRTALTAKRPPRKLPVIAFLPIIEQDFQPPPIRSKRIKVSAPRVMRAGERPQSLGSTMTQEELLHARLEVWKLEAEGVKFGPPKTFGECPKSGPCVRVSCRHHNYLEVVRLPSGKEILKLNFPHLEPQDLKEPCSLRVAVRAARRAKPRGPNGEAMSHEEIAAILNLTCERTRQLEARTMAHIKQERADLGDVD